MMSLLLYWVTYAMSPDLKTTKSVIILDKLGFFFFSKQTELSLFLTPLAWLEFYF